MQRFNDHKKLLWEREAPAEPCARIKVDIQCASQQELRPPSFLFERTALRSYSLSPQLR